MKKILSMLCTIALLFSVLAPVTSIEVSAAAWDGWTLTGGAYVEDGVLHVKSNAAGEMSQATASASVLTGGQLIVPDKYTLTFSMKVNSNASASMGLQGGNGECRAGFYLTTSRISAMDCPTTARKNLNMNDMGSWHDYVMEVDHVAKTQTVYQDDVLIGIQDLEGSGERNKLYFWSSGTSGDFEVSDFSLSSDVDQGDVMTLGPELTEPFRQDWDTIGGWMVEPGKQVTHYPEEGMIRLNVIAENGTYRSIERPLRPTKNYDMEFRVMLPEMEYPVLAGSTAFELSTDSRHTWVHVFNGYITFNNYAQDNSDPLYNRASNAIVNIDFQDNQWHVWKAEVRDEHITWYVDGKELVNYEMLKSKSNRWHFAFFQQNEHTTSGDIFIDWVEYTPYFEKEVTLVSPIERSVFAEGRDIEFRAEVGDPATEKVDYYVNEVYVGSGLKADNYAFTLKNAKVGQYKLKAKVGVAETAALSYKVEKAFESDFEIDKDTVLLGESVKATVSTKSVSESTQAAKVDFYLNGKLYATDNSAPFETTYTGMQVGTGAVFARAYSNAGTVYETEPQYINVEYVQGKALEIGREYTIDYKYNAGTGSFKLVDGYFTLDLAHNGERVTYKTIDGDETYENLGYGDYKVVVTAGYAELYYNTQFVTSFFMPYTPTKEKSTSNSGVTDVKIKGSGVKAEVFHTDWEGKAEFVRGDIMETYYYSVEFDKTDSSPEVVEFNDGVFKHKLHFREDGIYAERQLTKNAPVTEVKLTDKVEPGYYRLTVGWGISQLNLNNVPIGNYRASRIAGRRALKRTMTNPSASTFLAVKNSDDVYYHNDTFENITELPSEDFWSIHPMRYSDGSTITLTATKKTDKTGNHYMNVKGKGVYLLNAIDKFPTFKWRGMVTKREGKVFTMFRRSFGDRHDKLGYDFDKNQWFFDMVTEAGATIEADSKYDPNALQPNQWYDFELVCEDFSVALLCDGKEVFRTEFDNSQKNIYYGRLGFGAIDGEYNFDDVEYSGKNRASAGLNFTSAGRYTGYAGSTSDFHKANDGYVYSYNMQGSIRTNDRGKTWVDPIGNSSEQTSSGRINKEQMVKMPDGTLVAIKSEGREETDSMYSYVSYDNGESWEGPFYIQTGYGATSAVNRITCTMSGRVFVSTTLGAEYFGNMYVFYSDDGKTWEKSDTHFTTYNTGIIMNEATVVDTPRENEVWFYGRSDSGFLDYWISYDNGKTFDLTPHHSGLMQPETCFKIMRDWENPDTYYAIFVYDTETSNDKYIQQPRNRSTLGVSYDGMETWEFVCDIMEANDVPAVHTSDSMLELIDNEIYWRTSNYSGYGGIIFGTQELEKIKTLKRMPEFHYRTLTGTNVLEHLGYEHCVLPKQDGSAYLYNDYIDVKVSDGRIDADTAEKVFGVEITKSGSTAVLAMGNGKVTLTEGSTSIDVNGTAVTAERAALQGGMFDIKALCSVYGKVFRETDKSYSVLDGAEAIDTFQSMYDDLAQ